MVEKRIKKNIKTSLMATFAIALSVDLYMTHFQVEEGVELVGNRTPKSPEYKSRSSFIENTESSQGEEEILSNTTYDGIGATFYDRKQIINYERKSALEKYQLLIKGAENGDLASQYLLSDVFSECYEYVDDDFAPFYPESLGLMPDSYRDFLSLRKSQCEGIEQLATSKKQAKENGSAWLEGSAIEGCSLANLELNMTVFRDQIKSDLKLISDTRLLVYEAIDSAKDNPILMKEALWLGLLYYSDYVESELLASSGIVRGDGQKRGAVSEAWRLVYCTYDPECNTLERWSRVTWEYYEYEVDDIIRIAREITNATQSSNHDLLYLDIDSINSR